MNGPQLRIKVRDRVADKLVVQGAVLPARAVAFAPQGRFEQWLFARLRRRGAVIEAAPGRFYLYVPAYHAGQDRWERRAIPLAIGAIVIAILLMLLYV
jgi:hypothetical protein